MKKILDKAARVFLSACIIFNSIGPSLVSAGAETAESASAGMIYQETFDDGFSDWYIWRNDTGADLIIEEGSGKDESKCVSFICDSEARGSITNKIKFENIDELYISQSIYCEISSGTFQVKCTFYDSDNVSMGNTQIITLAQSSCNWRTKDFRLNVPSEARAVALEYVYSSAIGKIQFDDVEVWDGAYVGKTELPEGMIFTEDFNCGISDWALWRNDTSAGLEIGEGTGSDGSVCAYFYSDSEARGSIARTVTLPNVSELYISQFIDCDITSGCLQVRYTFYDESKRTLGATATETISLSSCNWRKKSFRIAVPETAASVKLEYVYSSAVGAIQIDDVEVWDGSYIEKEQLPEGVIYIEDFNDGISDWGQWRYDASVGPEIYEDTGKDGSLCAAFTSEELARGMLTNEIEIGSVNELYISQSIYADICVGKLRVRYNFLSSGGSAVGEAGEIALISTSCGWKEKGIRISVPENAAALVLQYTYSNAIGSIKIDDVKVMDGSYVSSERTVSEEAKAYAAQAHPRIGLSENRIAEINSAISDDEKLGEKYQTLIRILDRGLNDTLTPYDMSSGDLNLTGSNNIVKYAFGYQLTGDEKYAERALDEMLNVCGYQSWNAEDNYIDTAKILYDISLGYDWLYDYMTAAQRQTVYDTIVEKALTTAENAYNNSNYFVIMNNNYNIVSNSGVAMAVAALLDETNVTEISWLFDEAADCIIELAPNYFKDGSSTEGVTYWALAMRGIAMTDYVLPQFGYQLPLDYDALGRYMFASSDALYQSFNYGDADLTAVPGFYGPLFAAKTGNDVYQLYSDLVYAETSSVEVYDFLFYSGIVSPDTVDLEKVQAFEQSGVYYLRSDYQDKNAAFLGIKGGVSAKTGHEDKDIGSFVFTLDGIRWFEDLGKGSYQSEGYFDYEEGGRWQYLCKNAFGHNTITVAGEDQLNVYRSVPASVENQSVTIDLTSAYNKNTVNSLTRTAELQNEKTVLLCDQYSLKSEEEISWNYYTSAEVTITGDQVSLAKDGKTVLMQFTSEDQFVVSANPLEGYDGMTVINVKLNGSEGSLQTTVTGDKSLQIAATIVEQPEDVTCNVGDVAVFSVNAAGNGLSYQWQYNKGGDSPWVNSGASGNKTNSIAFRTSETQNGYQYRCIVSDSLGNQVISESALLITGNKAVIVKNPEDVVCDAGTIVRFSVSAVGVSVDYRWQYSKDNGETWINSGASGNKTESISFTANETQSGYMYRCLVTGADGTQVISTEALLLVGGKAVILSHPQNAEVKAGERVTFKVTAAGEELSYRWQWSKDGGKTWSVSGAPGNKTDTISFIASESQSGYMYRCIVTDGKGNEVTSDGAALISSDKAVIMSNPENVTCEVGERVSFTVIAKGNGLSYQWQYSTDGGANWKTSNAAGSKTAVLAITAADSQNGYMYRCAVTGADGTQVISTEALLIVGEKAVILSHPENAEVKAGERVTFKITAVGEELSYRWQWSKDGGKTWSVSGAPGNKTDTISFIASESQSGYMYRCIVTDGKGNEVTSDGAALISSDKAVIMSNPENVTCEVGERVSFTVIAKGNGLSYQWQYSTDGGANWKTSNAAGSKTAVLAITAADSQNGYMYRCAVTGADETQVISTEALLIVRGKAVILSHPENAEVNIGERATFKVTAAGEGIAYQWQWSKDGGKTWSVSGAPGNKTDTISFIASESQSGYRYRCVVEDTNGNQLISNNAYLVVGDKAVILSQPENITAKVGEQVVFAVEAKGKEITYQWQYSKDSGVTWINSGASGNKTNSIAFVGQLSQNNYMYRCVIGDVYGSQIISNGAVLQIESN
ncbi:MAG: heparinase II/III family protein [Ruminococcus sp.]|nr:heparinase II/III family protein [Ruminococcus sp.]